MNGQTSLHCPSCNVEQPLVQDDDDFVTLIIDMQINVQKREYDWCCTKCGHKWSTPINVTA